MRPTSALATKSRNPETQNPEPARRRPAGSCVSIETGDHRQRIRERRDALVLEHAGIVRGIAERLKAVAPAAIEIDDLIQTGMIALLHAAVRYRPESHSGAPFAVYARKCVRGAMLDSFSGARYRDAKMLPYGGDGDTLEHEPAIAPMLDEAIDDRRLAARIEDAIAYLDAPSQQVIRDYYRDEATLEKAGEELGIDRRRAGELHADAIARLKQILHVR